jgi:gephyrin
MSVQPILNATRANPPKQAIKPLLDREAPGLVHLLLSVSIQHTPLAALSRPVAGTRKNTLIVTFPGSVKAVKENLEALFTGGVIYHALDLVKGGTGKAVHATLAKSTSQSVQQASPAQGRGHHDHHHHHHGHGHQIPKPRAGASSDPSAPGKLPPSPTSACITHSQFQQGTGNPLIH